MYPWGHNRRFNSYSGYFQKKFGTRVQKLTLDAGFTCPNRDGTLGTGGCTFCNNEAFNPSYCSPSKTITQQLAEGVSFHQKRYRRATKYLAYFQAYSNTYASLDVLKTRYEEALAYPDVIGLVIGTRPDCISDPLLDYLEALSKKCYIVVEYGIESCRDDVLQAVNRGHSFSQSAEAVNLTAARGILTGAHIILGLPGESREDMLQGASLLSGLPLHSIKLHQLQIIKNTLMAEEYRDHPGRFSFLSLDAYLDLVADYLELLRPTLLVERIAGEVPPRFLAGPGFGLIRNDQILQKLEDRLAERNTWQGRLWRA
ncbi:MAG TPA: TIGR01212 family radical SAM protein [Bacteroidales bacterium]|nr:TIGR01212 family radical SAM protein [Bacteroidales bacterium]HSA42881.1 TIGR01212 family radical SAM protein [Bacteroidales bacterium]